MIELQPGDYVSTEGMTEEQYHAVCKAFMDAGAKVFEWEYDRIWPTIGWDKKANDLYESQRLEEDLISHGRFKRKLKINQILGSDNTEGAKEMNLQEAYKIMQANCGIEVGDTVKVLRKAEDYELGWVNSFTLRMGTAIEEEFKVIDIEGTGIVVEIDGVRCGFPFFVLELVKKGKKLPEPIRISSQYQCEFKEDGSIAVGCQSLDFDLIEKIYRTAKGLKGEE